MNNYRPPFKKGPSTGVELRYYKKYQYKKLTNEQKKELAELRAADEGTASTSKASTNQNTDVAALQQQISALKNGLVAALATDQSTQSTQQSDPLRNPLNQRSQS